jgi:hypothetical protein
MNLASQCLDLSFGINSGSYKDRSEMSTSNNGEKTGYNQDRGQLSKCNTHENY